MLQQVAAAEGYEARYAAQISKYAGVRVSRIVGGLVVRAPNADLSRDPAGAAMASPMKKIPFLVGTMSVAFVKGLQGQDPITGKPRPC